MLHILRKSSPIKFQRPLMSSRSFKKLFLVALFLFSVTAGPNMAVAQSVPPANSNIPFLVTFGKQASKNYGVDEHDEIYNGVNTKTKFSVYGGKGCWSDPDAQLTEPTGNYKAGTLLDSRSFGESDKYDNEWYSFGPLDPKEGEYIEEFKGYVFKIIAEGTEGDDGNLYRYFFSRGPNANIAIEGANAFGYEWTFRMPAERNAVCHLYPYINDDVVSIQQLNFDWDDDGIIKIVSYEKKGEWVEMSNEANWKSSTHQILPTERNSSLDIQFVKTKEKAKANNNVCFSFKNQYGEFMRFYTIPIGGVQRFKYSNGLIDKMREGERYQKDKVYTK